MLYQFGLFLTALLILIILQAIITLLYDWVAKLFERKPASSLFKPQNKQSRTIHPVVKKALKQRFEVEIKGYKVVYELNKDNFQELLSPYFIAVHYLHQLWLQHPFNLIITDRLQWHYEKDIKIEGFIRNKEIPEIFIKAKAAKKHRTGIILHEISHQLTYLDAKQKNEHYCSHGPEFKRHMKLLFQPLLVDRTYYRKHHELSYHLTYETNRFTPTRDMCV